MTLSSHYRSHRKFYLILGIFVFTLLLMMPLVIRPSFGPRLRACEAVSINNMRLIAGGIQAFQRAHSGESPSRLSEVVKYVPETADFYLHCPYANARMPETPSAAREFVDLLSPYRFIVMKDRRVVVFEQPEMWTDGTIGYCLLGANANSPMIEQVGRFRSSDFGEYFRHGFRALSQSGAVWRVQYRVKGHSARLRVVLQTPTGPEEKAISTPYASPTYDFYKFQHAGLSVQSLASNVDFSVTIVVNGNNWSQTWVSGDKTAINWIVGSSCGW